LIVKGCFDFDCWFDYSLCCNCVYSSTIVKSVLGVIKIGSVHIRIDSKLKDKLDRLREGQTTNGKYGYKRKVHYNDLIKDILNQECSFLEMQFKYSTICSMVNVDYDIEDTVNKFKDCLEFYLKTHNTNNYLYPFYNDLFNYLLSFRSRLEKEKSKY